jgi:hypothetical protein
MPDTIDELLAEAAALAGRGLYYLAREGNIRSVWPHRDQSTPEACRKSMRESMAQIKYKHDFAQNGPTFDRLKRAHPRTAGSELKEAIVAAVKFDDDCFNHLY